MTPRPSRLSPSAIARYRTCPKMFRLQDLERQAPKQEPSPIFARANAVHHALERFFGLPAEHRQAMNLERALRAVWPQHRKGGVFRNVDEEIEHGRAALEMLRLFGENFDLHAIPLAREQWLGKRLAGIEVYGKVDRIDPVRGGGIEIIDYKTGTRPLEPEDLKQEPATQVYVAAAESAYDENVKRVRLIYLPLAREVAWDLEPEDAHDLRSKLEKWAAHILDAADADTFPATPGPQCNWCPFALRCHERTQVRLEDLVPVEGLPFDDELILHRGEGR